VTPSSHCRHYPLARGGEVVDEVVAEPVARQRRLLERSRRLDQRARPRAARFRALVGAGDRRRVSFESLLDAVQAGGSTAAIARYGLMSAPGQRVSSRVAFGLPAMTRKLAVRLSSPRSA
jgi:hypothetical protein